MRLQKMSSVLIACILVFCAGSVVAQMDPGTGSPPRVRRTTGTDAQKPAAKDGAKKAGTKRDTEKTATKSAAANAATETDTQKANAVKDAPPAAQAESPEDADVNYEVKSVPVDPIVALREQIESAANGQEKGRLQLKLVDQLLVAGNKHEALNELHASVNEERFDPQGFYNMGNALARLGDSEGAVRAYRKAIEQRKGKYSRALNNLAVVLMRQGHWQQANEALTQALRLESFRYAEASYNLGRLYATQGEIDLAIREWRRAVYVDPSHSAAAEAIARAGEEDRIKVTSKVQPDKAGATGASTASRTTSGKGSSPSPRFSSPRVLTIDRETYSQLQRARNARERGKDHEAIASYRSVISRMGGYFGPANLELSYLLIGLKETSEARTYLREVTTRDGARYPISYYHLARIYEFNGELDLAVEAYGQAARHYAEVNPQFLLDISRVREKLGDFKGALSAMQEYLTAMERQGTKPDWSEERLTSLRQKAAASKPK